MSLGFITLSSQTGFRIQIQPILSFLLSLPPQLLASRSLFRFQLGLYFLGSHISHHQAIFCIGVNTTQEHESIPVGHSSHNQPQQKSNERFKETMWSLKFYKSEDFCVHGHSVISLLKQSEINVR